MYLCLTAQKFSDEDGYSLVPLRAQDIQVIRAWRNDQLEILRQKIPISKEQQSHYFEQVISPTFTQVQPSQILLSFLYREVCIGYGGLTHIDWESRRAEVSFLLDTKMANDEKNYGEAFQHYLFLLFQVAFKDLKFHRLFTETYAFRTQHMKTLESAGFRYEGRLREHIYKRSSFEDSIFHGILSQEAFP